MPLAFSTPALSRHRPVDRPTFGSAGAFALTSPFHKLATKYLGGDVHAGRVRATSGATVVSSSCLRVSAVL